MPSNPTSNPTNPETDHHTTSDRTKRVKESRDEAKKEIEAYRAKKEAEFKKFEAEVLLSPTYYPYHFFPGPRTERQQKITDGGHQHTQGNKAAEEEADREAEAKIKEIRAAGKKNQDKVVDDLLKAVFEVRPVPPSHEV
jgi:V-type H+-transporting ATPase subunit G